MAAQATSLIDAALSIHLVEAVEDKEPLEWIKKLVAFNPSCIGVAIPDILATTNPEPPSVEVIQVLAQLCPPDSVFSFLTSLLKSSNTTPSLKLVQLLVEKNPAALKQRDGYNFCYLLHYSCLYQPDFEIIQFLVNTFPAACLQPGSPACLQPAQNPNSCFAPIPKENGRLPLEILKAEHSGEKNTIDWMTKATIDIECTFIESVFAAKVKKRHEEQYKTFGQPTICGMSSYDEWRNKIEEHFVQQTFGQEILRANGSGLNRKRLRSKINVDNIVTIVKQEFDSRYKRYCYELLTEPVCLQLMERIHQVNKAKREFDKQTAVPFPTEPKTIITFD